MLPVATAVWTEVCQHTVTGSVRASPAGMATVAAVMRLGAPSAVSRSRP